MAEAGMIALIGRISPYRTINWSLSAAQLVVKVSVAMLAASINAKTMNTAPITMKNPVPSNKNGKLQINRISEPKYADWATVTSANTMAGFDFRSYCCPGMLDSRIQWNDHRVPPTSAAI